ncbi:unnamed protein product [Adineta ricciae]|uniref:Glutathione S-transferase n=1 Tax=Adineta ricciae TaxID=249248 RepID=A0A816FPV6_ADIRI|nr:unnamed protein product [Adineta ricciae]
MIINIAYSLSKILIVHHLGISQSERIVWLCEELEIPYQLIHYDCDLEDRLGANEYLAENEFTAADIMILFPSETIRAYLKGIGARRGYQRAMKKGDPEFTPLLD